MPRLLAALFTVLILCLGTTTPASALKPAATVAACNWNAPGHRPFMGDVVAAIDRYQDIPAAVRDTLRRRMAQRSYDEVVRIRRDSILGRQAYGAEIRDMHFADGQVCATVDRSGWTAQAEERGLVYCESGHCILVPTVCRNVSRIRVLAAAATAGTQSPPVAAANVEAGPSAGQSAGSGAGPQAPGGDSAALPLEQVRSALGAAAEPGGGQALPSAATWQDLASRVPADGNQPRPDGDWQTPALSPVSIRVPQGNLAPPLLPLLPLLPPVPPLPLLPQLPLLPPLPAVPEPASLVLMLAGLVALAWVQTRRRGRASVQRDFGAHGAGAVGGGGQRHARAVGCGDHPLGHRPVAGDLPAGQEGLQ